MGRESPSAFRLLHPACAAGACSPAPLIESTPLILTVGSKLESRHLLRRKLPYIIPDFSTGAEIAPFPTGGFEQCRKRKLSNERSRTSAKARRRPPRPVNSYTRRSIIFARAS